MTGLLIPTGAARPLFAVYLRDAAIVTLALFATWFCAFASAAAGTSLFPQILVVDYHPLTGTRVVGSPTHVPLYDYAYRVDVLNGGFAAADVSGKAGITASGISYTPTAALVEGADGVKLAIRDQRGNLPQANWSSVTRSAPEIIEVAPKDVVLNAQSVAPVTARYRDAGAGIDATRIQRLLDGADVTALAKHDAAGLSVKDKAGNSTAATWRFALDSGLPTIAQQTPRDVLLSNGLVRIGASYHDWTNTGDSSGGTGIDIGKIKRVDNIDVTARARIGATQISYPPALALAGGTHAVSLSVADFAGNSASSAWEFRLATPPQFGAVGPQDVMLPAGSKPTLFAELKNMGTGIDQVRMLLNSVDVTGEASITETAIRYTPAQALPAGRYLAAVQVANARGVFVFKAWDFDVDIPRAWRVQIVSPADHAVSAQANIEIVVAADSIGYH